MLVTRFFTADGLGQVVDFMPLAGSVATDIHRLVRILQCVCGRIEFDVELSPRFGYHLGSATAASRTGPR